MSPIQPPRRTPGTFLYSEPVSSLDDLAADIAFLGVPYAQAYSYEDITNDQSNGPTAMREASTRIVRSGTLRLRSGRPAVRWPRDPGGGLRRHPLGGGR